MPWGEGVQFVEQLGGGTFSVEGEGHAGTYLRLLSVTQWVLSLTQQFDSNLQHNCTGQAPPDLTLTTLIAVVGRSLTICS